jgi:GAF domain-containing protein
LLLITTVTIVNASRWINKPFSGFLINARQVVVDYGQYSWPGVQAGLKFPDKLVSANNKRIITDTDLEQVLLSTSIGTEVTYVFERHGQRLEVTLPTMRFTAWDLMMTFGIELVAALLYFSLGVVVFIMKPDSELSWVFFGACSWLGVYVITGFDVVSTHKLLLLYHLATAFLPASFTHLSLVFPYRWEFIKRRPAVVYIPHMISAIAFVPFHAFYPGPVFLALYPFLYVYLFLSAIATVMSGIFAYLEGASTLAKQRAKVLLIGAAAAFPIPALMYVVPLVGGSWGRLTLNANFIAFITVVYPACIAFAIAKHNLFDVDVYIKRAVGYVVMTTIVGLAYLSLQTLASTAIYPVFGDYAEQVYPMLFALLVVFLFNPVSRKVQDGVDKIFFRKKFDYKETMISVTNVLTSVLNLNAIIEKIIHTVKSEMFIDTVGMLVLEPQKKAWHTVFIRDETPDMTDSIPDGAIAYDDPLLTLLAREKRLITIYDIAEDSRYAEVKEPCEQRFSAMAASLAIPLIYQGEVTGVLALGHKKSGHFYTREDIDLLTTLAYQGAVAIANAKLFEENLEKGRMEEELKIAHDIQISMLPEKAPRIEGFTIAARSIPAREVGGDFYDFIEVRGDGAGERLAIVVGDVSGKAVSGALVMAASRSIFRVLAEAHASVEEVMSVGNARLNRDIKKGMFVALLYAVLDPQHRTLALSNAGQTQPIICSRDRPAPMYRYGGRQVSPGHCQKMPLSRNARATATGGYRGVLHRWYRGGHE